MVLSTPVLKNIDAFDPSNQYNFDFIYSGNQISKTRLIIIDNSTYKLIYDQPQTGTRLSYILPGTILSENMNGYIAQIQVFDSGGNSSELSDQVLFYCINKPDFYFNNIQNDAIVRSASVSLSLIYKHENEKLSEYQLLLYDAEKSLISYSPINYSDKIDLFSFNGLNNEYTYYVRAIGTTSHKMRLDTGFIKINIQYYLMPANMLFKVINHKREGYISLETGIIDVGYKLRNDNYEFDDSEVTLWDNELTYYEGLNINDDFSIFIEARSIPVGIPILINNSKSNEKIYLEIVKIYKKYYGKLVIPYRISDYIIYKEFPQSLITDLNEDYILTKDNLMMEIIGLDDDAIRSQKIIFEIRRKGCFYNLYIYLSENIKTQEVLT